jgi:deoxyribodipyrimidine photo-lyase
VLAAAGVELGTNYPHPIVDHGQARLEALDALATISASKGALKD